MDLVKLKQHTDAIRSAAVTLKSSADAIDQWAVEPPPPPPPPPPAEPVLTPDFVISKQHLQNRTSSGPGWNALLALSDQPFTIQLNERNDTVSNNVIQAAAYRWFRTGSTSHQTKVVSALAGLPSSALADELSLSRQLAGYLTAASVVNHRPTALLNWVSGIRTRTLPKPSGRWPTLESAALDSGNNRGAFALASLTAANLYIGDLAGVKRCWQVFKGWCGDRTAWPGLPIGGTGNGFIPTGPFVANQAGPTWCCTYPDWSPINGQCGDRDGAIPEDCVRDDQEGVRYPTYTSKAHMYTMESLNGLVHAALMFHRAGLDPWSVGNRALFRALQFANRMPVQTSYGTNYWMAWALQYHYREELSRRSPAGSGREFAGADWLYSMS